MTYREIPFSEYQKRANELLRKHGVTENDELPIDPETIIRREGIELIPSAGLKQRFGIKGCVAKVDDTLQIYVDQYHYENEPETAFLTLGEELGHCVLHLEDFKNIHSIRDWLNIIKNNQEFSRKIENQARMFGSNIILPSFVFEPFIKAWMTANLKNILCFSNYNEDVLQGNIASLLEDELRLSYFVIYYALGRYPDRPINWILSNYPQLLKKKDSDQVGGDRT